MDFQVGILMDDLETREYLASQWGKKGTTSDISLYSVSSSYFNTISSVFPQKNAYLWLNS